MMFGIGFGYYVLKSGMTDFCVDSHVMPVDCVAGMTERCTGPRVMRVDCAGTFKI